MQLYIYTAYSIPEYGFFIPRIFWHKCFSRSGKIRARETQPHPQSNVISRLLFIVQKCAGDEIKRNPYSDIFYALS